MAGAVGALRSYHWRADGGPRVLLAGSPHFTDRWRGFDFQLGPESFLQVNRAVAEHMETHIDGLLGDIGGVRVLDLYAGVGGRALAWAAKGADVSAGEVDGEAVESGRRTARAAGLSVDLCHGRVEELLPEMLPAEAILVNPPRRGLSASVSETLAGCGARLLLYVSCDPATLARDIGRLGSRWTLESVQPFDAFPHTYHVETVALLRSSAGGPAGHEAGGPA